MIFWIEDNIEISYDLFFQDIYNLDYTNLTLRPEGYLNFISLINKIIDNQRILHLAEQAELARIIGLEKTLVKDDDNFNLNLINYLSINKKYSFKWVMK